MARTRVPPADPDPTPSPTTSAVPRPQNRPGSVYGSTTAPAPGSGVSVSATSTPSAGGSGRPTYQGNVGGGGGGTRPTRPTSGASTSTDPYVQYGGTSYNGSGLQPTYVQSGEATDDIYALKKNNPALFENVVRAMRARGWLSEGSEALSSIRTAWAAVVKAAAKDQSNPFAVLGLGAGTNPGTADHLPPGGLGLNSEGQNTGSSSTGTGGGSSGSSVGGGGAAGGTSTATSSDVNLTNKSTAESILNSALAQYLGRDATPDEVQAFKRSLNSAERANPQESTRTTSTDGAGSSSSQGVSRGGVNAQQKAEDFARAQEGSAEFQAAGRYMKAFDAALAGD